MKKPTKHYRSKTKFIWFLIAMVGLFIIGGSLRYQKELRNFPAPPSSPTPIADVSVDSWNKYLNLRYRYIVGYPKNTKFFAPDRTVDSNEYVQTKPTSHTKGVVQIESLSNVGYSIAITPESISPGANLKSVIIKNEGVVGDVIPGRKGAYELLTWDRPVVRFESLFDRYGVESYRFTTYTPGEEIADIDAFYVRVSPTNYIVISNTVPTYGEEITRMLETIALAFHVVFQWVPYPDLILGLQFDYPGEARVIEQNNKRIIRGPYPEYTYDGNYQYDVILEMFYRVTIPLEKFANEDYEKEISQRSDAFVSKKVRTQQQIANKESVQITARDQSPESHYSNVPFYNKTFIQLQNNSVLVITGGTYAIFDNTEPVYQQVLKTLRFTK